jgi:hypothetical protein
MGEDLATIKQLLVSGADPNTFSPTGCTPLYHAAHVEQQPFPPAKRIIRCSGASLVTIQTDVCLPEAVIIMDHVEDGQEPFETNSAFAVAK